MAEPQAGPVPTEALEYFDQKKLKIGFDHRDVWREEHVANFTVAKVTQLQVLGDIQASMRQALERGETLQTWVKNIRPELEKAGWWGKREVVEEGTGEIRVTDLSNPHRLETLYDTNMRQARAAGQWQRIQRTKAALPYLLYLLGPSVHHREDHAGWAGTCLPADDPWWLTHMPQNGYRCKCHVRQVGRAEFARLQRDGLALPITATDPETGKPRVTQEMRDGVPTGRLITERRPIKTSAPPVATRKVVNKRTGVAEQVPVGIDPGFDTNPGAVHRVDQVARRYTQQLTALPADIGAESFGLVKDRVLPVIERDFERWSRQTVARGTAQKQLRVVGAIKPKVVRGLAERGLEPESAAIAVRDDEILHSLRPDKAGATTTAGKPKGLTIEELVRLPAMLDAPLAVLLEPATKTLLYVLPAQRREAVKLVVRMDLRLKTVEGATTVNSFRTGSLIDFADVTKDLKAGTLELLDGNL